MPFASWSVVTVDFLAVLHLALDGVTLAALLHLVNAKWRYDIRYLSVSFFALHHQKNVLYNAAISVDKIGILVKADPVAVAGIKDIFTRHRALEISESE